MVNVEKRYIIHPFLWRALTPVVLKSERQRISERIIIKKGNYSAWDWCQLGDDGHEGLPKGLKPVKHLSLHPHSSRSYHVGNKVVCGSDLTQKCCPTARLGCCDNTGVCIAVPLLRATTTPSASAFSLAHAVACFTCANKPPEQISQSLPLTCWVPLDRLPSTSSPVNQLYVWTVSGGWYRRSNNYSTALKVFSVEKMSYCPQRMLWVLEVLLVYQTRCFQSNIAHPWN